jgi:hypothetical protein
MYVNIERLALDLIHMLDAESDNATRMKHAAAIHTMLRQRLIDIRNEAAYEARDGVTTSDLQSRTGIERGSIESWSRTWAEKRNLPLRKNRINRPWQVGYKNLTGE